MPTRTRSSRVSNLLSYTKLRDRNTVRQRFNNVFASTGKIQPEDVTVLSHLPKKSWMSCKNSSIDCIFTAQIRWNKKRLFNWNAGIFSRSWIKKNKLLLEKIELNHLFWEGAFQLLWISFKHNEINVSFLLTQKLVSYRICWEQHLWFVHNHTKEFTYLSSMLENSWK